MFLPLSMFGAVVIGIDYPAVLHPAGVAAIRRAMVVIDHDGAVLAVIPDSGHGLIAQCAGLFAGFKAIVNTHSAVKIMTKEIAARLSEAAIGRRSIVTSEHGANGVLWLFHRNDTQAAFEMRFEPYCGTIWPRIGRSSDVDSADLVESA